MSRRITIPSLVLIAALTWAWSLRTAYQAGEERLLMRIRHLPAEQQRWQQDADQQRPHADAAGRCLQRLDRLYAEEHRLWDRYERLNQSAARLSPQS